MIRPDDRPMSRRTVLQGSARLVAAAALWDVLPTAGAQTQRSGPPLVFPAGVAVLCAADEPAAVRRAVDDLCRDLNKVMGVAPARVRRVAEIAGRPALVVTCDSDETREFRDAALTGREAHALTAQGTPSEPRFVLQGTDARGAIYAVYTFSEQFLGIPPLWFWTLFEPSSKAQIHVDPGLKLTFASPAVKWRTWFPNDTDLFAPWVAADASHLDALHEAMLRLKLNCIEGVLTDDAAFATPYTAASDIRAARDRGIAFCGHHVTVLGAAYRQWDAFWTRIEKRARAPKLSIRQTDDLERFWRYHVGTALREKIECVWIIGFRGDGDRPFWENFSDAPPADADRARVIADMMRRQITLLKQETGDPKPEMRCTLYNENSDFVAKGLLRPPEEPTLIWSFVAARRDHFPAADIRTVTLPPQQPVGYYFNYQFTSTGSHLVPGEGPCKMEANFRFARSKADNALRFSVVNMGNIREFVTEGAAYARMMWDFDGFRTDAWLADFCRTYFGTTAAADVAGLFRAYYDSYWQQRHGDLPGFDRQYVFQDFRISRGGAALIRVLNSGVPNRDPFNDEGTGKYRIVPADNGAADALEAVIVGSAESIRKLRHVVDGCHAVRPKLTANGRRFFDVGLFMHARWLLAAHQWLNALARGVDALSKQAHYDDELDRAVNAINDMRDLMRDAQQGPFANWYLPDRLWDVAKLQRLTVALRDKRSVTNPK